MIKAAIRDKKIMNEYWIDELWKLSKTGDESYTTDDFYQRFKVPIFYKLVITSSGISEADKKLITKLVKNNGGTFAGSFKSKETDILITQPNQIKSDKFKAAVKCRKECLLVDWIKDSVTKGYALPFVSYRIFTRQSTQKVMNSTAVFNKSIKPSAFCGDESQLSGIYNVSIAETIKGPTPTKKTTEKDYKQILKTIDMNAVKSAEGCLDGCTIFLCGFDVTDINILKKIINIGGAIRIDEHGPSVEYVIVGKPTSSDLSAIKSSENSNIVTIDWLIECINSKTTADAKEFLYKSETLSTLSVPSPASKRNIENMNPFRRPDYVPRTLLLAEDEKMKKVTEKTLLEQYSQPTKHANDKSKEIKAPPSKQAEEKSKESSEETTQEIEVDPNLFRGLTFALTGFSEESTDELRSELEEYGATVVEATVSQTVDYLVVPNEKYNIVDIRQNAKEIVNDLWVVRIRIFSWSAGKVLTSFQLWQQDCMNDNQVVDIKYFHRAILLKSDSKPLQGLNIVFSTYTTPERDYLYSLADALGGTVNDRYIRNESPILICSTPVGQKYQGAIKWNLPVVTCEWLKKCYEMEKKVSMREYTVGEAKCDDDEVNQEFENEPQVDRPNVSKNSARVDSPMNEGTKDVIAEAQIHSDDNVTPARHPRISALKNDYGRQSVSPNSPRTPPPINVTPGGTVVSPTTGKYKLLFLSCNEVVQIPHQSKDLVSVLTPKTRTRVYKMLKEHAASETPLTKRRRLENPSDSPPKSLSELVDPFEIIDRKYIEIPKERPSTPFVEFRKRIYRGFLGDKYEGTPLRAPKIPCTNTSMASENIENPTNTSVSVANNENDDKPSESEKTGGDGSTQVREFFNSIKKCRESRPSHTDTQQIAISKQKVNVETEEELPNESPQQIEVIDWRDPEDFFQSERFVAESRSKFKGTRCFSMSMTVEIEVKEQIRNLGGVICKDLVAFDPSCTHLICSKLSQSEKISSVIAGGRWLLCPAYIEDSFKAGHFLNEEDYEWGNPRAAPKLPGDLDAIASNIAKVNHKRRKELQEKSEREKKPVGIFTGFRAILHIDSVEKKASYKRLLEAGCGVVIDIGKENIFVLEEFEGDAFQHLALTKAIVLGPRVVISCQLTDDAVPNIASPIYTLALKNAVVRLSGLSAEKREENHKLVGFMGGLWTKDLRESTTHLITNTVTTAKYESSVSGEISFNCLHAAKAFSTKQISKSSLSICMIDLTIVETPNDDDIKAEMISGNNKSGEFFIKKKAVCMFNFGSIKKTFFNKSDLLMATERTLSRDIGEPNICLSHFVFLPCPNIEHECED
ncbi:DNA topoisomerase 2-binding protein 1 [Pseudolycoriella hygida]|uniref:DNA topoisomerase 2-binding protein 1 n=1 Tax=Pseudolycoriella hygida TaxID=35572 RepID=A0A9Q0S535_9DIPT|nr:DNA topoisomerase 2-binding protein 1 [Pseudolycoriella hygida]